MTVTLLPAKQSAFNRELTRVWESLTPSSCPEVYNFHLHTHCSDGALSPQELIQQAVKIGLRGLAITDHHCVSGYYQAQHWLAEQNHEAIPPKLWTGVEITADLAGTEVHILGYAFDPEHPELSLYLEGDRPVGKMALAQCVVDAIHAAGGLVVLAHPARYKKSAAHLIPLAARLGIDGVEAYYAYGNPKPWCSSQPQMEEVCQLSELYELWRTCGTDSHGRSILQRI